VKAGAGMSTAPCVDWLVGMNRGGNASNNH
jgi:hypothetical protein